MFAHVFKLSIIFAHALVSARHKCFAQLKEILEKETPLKFQSRYLEGPWKVLELLGWKSVWTLWYEKDLQFSREVWVHTFRSFLFGNEKFVEITAGLLSCGFRACGYAVCACAPTGARSKGKLALARTPVVLYCKLCTRMLAVSIVNSPEEVFFNLSHYCLTCTALQQPTDSDLRASLQDPGLLFSPGWITVAGNPFEIKCF